MATNPLQIHARRVYSQNDDDGILEGIFQRLGVTRGTCVDVGANDGLYLSNTANLILHHGWGGVLIEGSSKHLPKLRATMQGRDNVRCIEALVSFEGENTLDAILDRAGVPNRFDLLSIDVDGIDFHIWESLSAHTPTVVIVEYNPSIPNHVEFVQPRDGSINYGNAIRSLERLGRRKGYVPVYVTETNLIVVHRDSFARLGVPELSLDELRDDRPLMTCMFQGFDGTLFLDGPKELYWQHLPIDHESIQLLPKFLRRMLAGNSSGGGSRPPSGISL